MRALLRLRSLAERWFSVLVIVSVLVAATGVYITHDAYASPAQTTEAVPGPWWETTGTFDYGATVTKSNPVYTVGSRVSARQAYFYSVMPVLDGAFTFDYAASDEGTLTADVDTQLIHRAVDTEQDGDEVVYWERNTVVERRTFDGVTPGQSVAVPFSVNMTEEMAAVERIEASLGQTVEPETMIVTSVRLRGTVNGQAVDRTEQYRLRIEDVGTTYNVIAPPDEESTVRYDSERVVTIPAKTSTARLLAGAMAVIAGIVGIGVLLGARRRGLLSLADDERKVLSFDADRQTFDDWITSIYLPEEAFSRPRARATSLGNLVDFAIDTGNSVVEDPDETAFYVLHGEYLYVYEPPTLHGAQTTETGTPTAHDETMTTESEKATGDEGVNPADD